MKEFVDVRHSVGQLAQQVIKIFALMPQNVKNINTLEYVFRLNYRLLIHVNCL